MINGKKPTNVDCNCRNSSIFPLNGHCQQNDVIYKCIAFISVNPDKVYLRTAEGTLKNNIITIISFSDTEVMLMKLLFLSTYEKLKINTMRCPP